MKAALFMIFSQLALAGQSNAQTLHLSSCEFAVVLRPSSLGAPTISSASASAGVSLQALPDGVRLVCAKPNQRSEASARGSSSVIISGTRINRAIGPGAIAEQNIGGQRSTARSEDPVKTVVISVPSAWRIQARSWIGLLHADTGIWQADVEIAAGEMSFFQLKDSRVVVDAGSFTAQSLQGRFDAHLRGAGDIEVLRSNDAQLNLQLSGAGSMSFKGRAQSAVIRASGIGSIEIEKVITEPKISSSSLTTIDIGR